MHQFETPELRIIILDFQQLESYVVPDKLEKELGLVLNGRVVSEKVKTKITRDMLPKIRQSSPENIFSTFWIIIDKNAMEIAAEFCFKHGDKRTNEIGYATFPQFRNRGIMTSALYVIAIWVFENTALDSISAVTDPENIASNRVLEKSGFRVVSKDQNNLYWQKER